ncbi:class I SAM-dependent methyltransferase [Streptomyces sp. NPDC005728]|uniref:bifunctional class I SAM-dependent methyltransferase/NUDIX hydrolase n=1 Tax=Streptomyces sp. NPDC005728 TaxID=3157054 RepID=UPI0033DF55B4
MFTTQDEWDRGYADGRRYRQLTDAEPSLLATYVPPPAGGKALDIGCGTGALAAHLSSTDYAVDAVDWSGTALAEAGTRHGDAVRRLRLDVEQDDWAPLHTDGYNLITLRFVAPFLSSRDRTLDALGHRLRPSGALVVITALAVGALLRSGGIGPKTGPRMPLNKVGFIFDGGRLTGEQLRRIRLDPVEHDMWAVHDLVSRQELMAPRAFARLDAIERARRGEGLACIITHT